MADRQIDGPFRKSLPSLDPDKPYPMHLEQLGHSVIINNLRSEFPQTAVDVEAVMAALQTVGFAVKLFSNCNVQKMREIKDWIGNSEVHAAANCFCLVILCHKIEQGWILDWYRRRAFTIEQVAATLSETATLKGKPKILLIQESKNGSDECTEELPVQQDKQDLYIVCSTYSGESKNGASYLQEFASNLMKHFLTEPLRRIFWMTNQSLLASVKIPATLEESELMTLAGKISTDAMRIIAIEKLEIESSEVKTMSDANRENQQFMKFELFNKWKNKNPRNTRQRLAAILRSTEGNVDSKMVDKVLRTGELEDQIFKQFDSFTHVFKFAEFYTEKPVLTETAGRGKSAIDHNVAVQLQEKIQELQRELINVKTLSSTQDEKHKELSSQLRELKAKLQEKDTDKTLQEASSADAAKKTSKNKPNELEIKRKEEVPAVDKSDEVKEEESHCTATVLPPPIESQVPAHEKSRHVELFLISSYSTNLKSWRSSTVLGTGEIAVWGRKNTFQTIFLFTLVAGSLKETQIKAPCPHEYKINLLSVKTDNHEGLAGSCYDCETIYFINFVTKQATKAFSGCRAWAMCKGDDDNIYLRSDGGPVLKLAWLGSTLQIIERFNISMDLPSSMCYLPHPHGALVFSHSTDSEIKAFSCSSSGGGNNVIWKVQGELDDRCIYPNFVFYSCLRDLLFIIDSENGRLLVLNPCDGSHVQTIALPPMGEIRALIEIREQIVLLHEIQDKYKISNFSVK